MKNAGLKIASLALIVVLLSLMLGGCVLKFDADKYMTREEIDKLIDDSMVGDVTVQGGDNFNVNIEGVNNPNVLAASKGLLATVSVSAEFTYSSGYGPNFSSTSSGVSKGAGVIYKLDKNAGDAYIITNYHVIYEASSNTKNHISNAIYVELYGMENCGKEIYCEYVGGSMYYDIAVLKIKGSRILAESIATAVDFCPSDEVSVLDTAIAIGNPDGEGISATVGYVNVDSEYIEMRSIDGKSTVNLRVMRIDTAVNSGNSGGGLFGSDGRLIGIVNAKSSSYETENIAYAIPSTLVKQVADNILDYCDGTEIECVRRAMVGITVGVHDAYVEFDEKSGKVYRREVVKVSGITVGGVAEGRLLENDIIKSVTIDGVVYECDRLHKATESMITARVGSSVVFNIVRDGVEMSVELPITDATLTDW